MSNNSFIFISGHHRSDQERKIDERKARSHTARINKRNRQGLLYCSTVDVTANEECSTSTDDEPRRRPQHATDEVWLLRTMPYASPSAPVPVKEEDGEFKDHAVSAVSTGAAISKVETVAPAPLRRSVSPTLGAATTNTFALGSWSLNIAQATDYCELNSSKRQFTTTPY